MDRRRFLAFLGTSGAGIALSPMTAISLEDDWYVNSRLKIKLRKPANWQFVSVADFTRLMDDQQEKMEDGKLIEDIRRLSGDPMLVINKYVRPFEDRACPTIQIFANPLDQPMGEIVEDARLAEEFFRPYHRDYSLESEPRLEAVGGILGATWRYRDRLGAGRGYTLRAWAGLVRASRAEFSIAMLGADRGVDESEREFRAVRASISLS